MAIPRLVVLIALACSALFFSKSASANGPRLVVVADGAAAAPVAGYLRTTLAQTHSLGDPKVFRRGLPGEWENAKLVDVLASGRRQAALRDIRFVADLQGVSTVVLLDVRSSGRSVVAAIAIVGLRGEPFETRVNLRPKSNPEGDATLLYAEIEAPLVAMLAADAAAAAPEQGSKRAKSTPNSSPRRSLLASIDGPQEPATPGSNAGAQPSSPEVVPPPPYTPRASSAGTEGRLEEAIIVVAPEVGFGARHFGYTDRVTPTQRSYDLAAAPVVGVSVELYPLAWMDTGYLRGLGVGVGYGRAVLLQSAPASGNNTLGASGKVDTSWSQADVVLRDRIPLSQRTTLGAKVGYGGLDYSFDGAGAMQPELPSVGYRFVRMGVDARVRVWILAVSASADYLAVTSSGALSDRYPRATSGGVDLSAGVAIPLAANIEARTGVRYQRFFHSMNPEPGDANVVGGALDEFARWDTSVAFHYGGP
jgi:hypothetical protein